MPLENFFHSLSFYDSLIVDDSGSIDPLLEWQEWITIFNNGNPGAEFLAFNYPNQ